MLIDRPGLPQGLVRLFPLGWPWRETVCWTALALGGAALYALLAFLLRLARAVEQLYARDMFGGRLELIPGSTVPPFPQLFGGGLFWFWVAGLCLVLLPLLLCLWHWRGSRSIYLMRRLPRRGELPRRCLAGPALLLVLTLLAAAAAVGLCALCYRSLTPAGHLPADAWSGMGGILCWF